MIRVLVGLVSVLSLIGVFSVRVAMAGPTPARAEMQEVQLPFDLFKFEGSILAAKKVQKFAEVELTRTLKPRGQVIQLAYLLPSGNVPLEILENYKNSYQAQKFEVRQEAAGPFHAEAAQDGRIVILARAENGGESYVSIDSFSVRENWRAGATREYFGTLVKLDPQQVVVLVQLVVPKAIEQKMVQEQVNSILGKLASEGRVSLYGIYFDVDKTALKPESDAVLAEVAKALSQDLSLRLSIVGHTDNTGDSSHNQLLSEGRAKAVLAALTARGISESRLSAIGKGDSQPVAGNETEDGRAKNRRVELVRLG